MIGILGGYQVITVHGWDFTPQHARGATLLFSKERETGVKRR